MRGIKRSLILKKPRVLIPVILLVVLIGIAVSAVRNLNSPAEGTITTQLNNDGDHSDTQTTLKSYSDAYFSFKYPVSYVLQPNSKNNSYLDSVSLIGAQRRDKFVAISLQRESLTNDSGVNYRKAHPELYKIVSATNQTIVFSKIDKTEYTGFTIYNDMTLAISLTSVSSDDLGGIYNQMSGSVQWAQ